MNQLSDIFFANLNAIYRMGGFFMPQKARIGMQKTMFLDKIFFITSQRVRAALQ